MKSKHGDFEELQQLLASRRHVRPPAQILDGFSDRIKDRLENPEPTGPLTWKERLGLDADWKPAIMCAWGLALCASLVVGIIVSLNLFQQRSFQTPIGVMPGGDQINKAWEQFGTTAERSGAPLATAADSSVEPVLTLSE